MPYTSTYAPMGIKIFVPVKKPEIVTVIIKQGTAVTIKYAMHLNKNDLFLKYKSKIDIAIEKQRRVIIVYIFQS